MTQYRFLLALCSLVALTGCKIDLGLDKPSENIRDGLSDLSKGVKNFDAIGLKKFFDENKDLTEKLKIIEKATTSIVASSSGHVVLANTKIKLHIAAYTGEFVLNAWNGDQQISNGRLLPLVSRTLPDLSTQYRAAVDPLSSMFPNRRLPIDPLQYAQWIYNRSQCVVAKPNVDDLVLNYTFGDDGMKTIRLDIIPLHAAAGDVWNMDGEIRAESADGKSDLIQAFSISKEIAPLGKSYSIAFNILVKSDLAGPPYSENK